MSNNKLIIFCLIIAISPFLYIIFASQRECKTHPHFAEIELGYTKDGCKVSNITVKRNDYSCSLDTFKVVKCPNPTQVMVVGAMVCNGHGSCTKDKEKVIVE